MYADLAKHLNNIVSNADISYLMYTFMYYELMKYYLQVIKICKGENSSAVSTKS